MDPSIWRNYVDIEEDVDLSITGCNQTSRVIGVAKKICVLVWK